MENIRLEKTGMTYLRGQELIRVTPCGANAIRFEAFPAGEAFDDDVTLLPGTADPAYEERDYCAFMTVGDVKCQLERSGKVTFYVRGVSVLEELPASVGRHGSIRIPFGTAAHARR